MSDFKKDFAHHAKEAGAGFAAGNHKKAMHHIGHMAQIAKASNQGAPGVGNSADVAANASPVGFQSPTETRGFGPGKQFGKGSATGTPKPSPLHGKQTPSIRGILSKMKGFGGAQK